jgi:sugar (pentulose or hexulose) kinase
VPEACHAAVRTAGRIEPQAAAAPVYEALYQRYREFYPKLKGSLAALGALAADAAGDVAP